MIVIDPRVTETAELADVHLRVKPGTDAWCLAALVGVLVQEDLVDRAWVAAHTDGSEVVVERFSRIPVDEYADVCGVPAELLRDAARRIAAARAWRRSRTWASRWASTRRCARTWRSCSGCSPATSPSRARSTRRLAGLADPQRWHPVGDPVSPVVGARIISGLVPCNVISEEILTDHPARYRAMLVESGNPAHSLADSARMREALQSLDLLVVIDVAMTETARLAHYVLPAPTQFEKHEATFFNFEFPHNVFHLRRPVVEAPDGPLPEAEIHARIVEALGLLPEDTMAPLREAATQGRAAFADAFFTATAADPMLGALAPVVLYRALGTDARGAVGRDPVGCGTPLRSVEPPVGATCDGGVGRHAPRRLPVRPGGPRRLALGEALFEAILASPSGVTFLVDDWDVVWSRVRDGVVHLAVPEMLAMLDELATPPATDPDFPFVLSAGERRSFTANTIIREPGWRKRDAAGALRVNEGDAAALGLSDGAAARITTAAGSAVGPSRCTPRCSPATSRCPTAWVSTRSTRTASSCAPASPRTTSPAASTATRSPAPRTTSTSPPASNPSDSGPHRTLLRRTRRQAPGTPQKN